MWTRAGSMGGEKVDLWELYWAEWKETTKAKSWAAATVGDSVVYWALQTAKSVAASLGDQRAAE